MQDPFLDRLTTKDLELLSDTHVTTFSTELSSYKKLNMMLSSDSLMVMEV